jgi:hypothetical protein
MIAGRLWSKASELYEVETGQLPVVRRNAEPGWYWGSIQCQNVWGAISAKNVWVEQYGDHVHVSTLAAITRKQNLRKM